MTHDQDGSPSAGLERLNRPVVDEWRRRVALQEALQQGQKCLKGITPPEIENQPLLDTSIFANRLDDAHIFVDHAGRTGDFDGADEHDEVLASSLNLDMSRQLWNQSSNIP